METEGRRSYRKVCKFEGEKEARGEKVRGALKLGKVQVSKREELDGRKCRCRKEEKQAEKEELMKVRRACRRAQGHRMEVEG